jgi:hypothetical protein
VVLNKISFCSTKEELCAVCTCNLPMHNDRDIGMYR